MKKEQRVGKLKFSKHIPEQLQDTIIKPFAEYEWLIPNWCEEVHVRWMENGGGGDGASTTNASVGTRYDYRYAYIDVCPPFVDNTEESHRDTARHELVHITNAPIYNYVIDMLDTLYPDPTDKIRILIEKELTERIESVTQDMATNIARLEERKKRKPTKKRTEGDENPKPKAKKTVKKDAK